MGEAALRFPFDRGGYRHVLLARVGPWCVVERTWIEDGRPHLPHFEVVQLRTAREHRAPTGAIIPAHEAYPAPRDWGRIAWSVPTLVHARQRWEGLRRTGKELPEWTALGIPDDEEGYRAWKEGRLPCRMASAPTTAILGGHP